MVFLGLQEPFTKVPENSDKTKNGKGNNYPPGHPYKGTFNAVFTVPILDVLYGVPGGAADQVKVLEDAGHVINA
jgi:hypothetical protein